MDKPQTIKNKMKIENIKKEKDKKEELKHEDSGYKHNPFAALANIKLEK